MLKYKVLKDNSQSNLSELSYSYWNVVDDYMVFYSNKDNNLENETYGKIIGEHRLINSSNNNSSEYTFSDNVTIITENNPREFKIKKFTEYPLYVNNIKELSGNKIIYFTNPHFFKNGSSASLIMYYVGTNLSVVKENLNVMYDTEYSVKYNGLLPQQYEFYRSDFRFEEANKVLVYTQNGAFNITIPFGNEFATNGRQAELVQDKFVNYEINKSITPIINIEKDVYNPIIKSIEEPINEIELNLHFRERESKDWLVKAGGFWNGYTDGVKNDVISIFNKPEQQSDLFNFLDISNNDIRYQKNNLKKSFVRMSFYDSNNQANQNLLYYSTVFIDSGKQYGKYVKFTDGKYSFPTYDEEGKFVEEKFRTGITVNSEPYSYKRSDGTEVMINTKDDNIKELRRLSSRLSIKDKFNSDASSEGFYLYMFAEEDPNLRHKSIYLKVEFNHAGYGRIIPFMRPTNFNKTTLENGTSLPIDAIISECQPKDGDKEGGYDLETYYIHSYIEFKCGYNKKLNKHVYYLDNEDDLSIDIDNRKLILNLYEAKVR